jgi:hypothetical protein
MTKFGQVAVTYIYISKVQTQLAFLPLTRVQLSGHYLYQPLYHFSRPENPIQFHFFLSCGRWSALNCVKNAFQQELVAAVRSKRWKLIQPL